jgi:ribosomal protein L7/L12
MDIKHLLIAAVLVAVLFVLWMFIKSFRKERPRVTQHAAPPAPAPAAPAQGGLPPLSRAVMEIASDPGRKISAIKAYREETGLGLKEAKDAVEAWMAGGQTTKGAAEHLAAHSPGPWGGAAFTAPLSQHVQDIARDASHKIAAIKAYREETGAGLAEAKNAVEAWRRSQGLE